MELRYRVRNLDEVALVEIGGEIDLHSAPQLRAALAKCTESAAPRVVIDLSEVLFVDSTGIGVLVGALKRARENGGDTYFCGAAARVKRVLEITGLTRVLPQFASREAAIAAFGTQNGAIQAAGAADLEVESRHE